MEQGESKSALVKVALCEKCVKKLMWKREKEKEMDKGNATAGLDFQAITGDTADVNDEDPLAKRRKKKSRDEIPEASSSFHPETRRRRRSSRSRSPRRRQHSSDINSRR